MGLGGLKMIAIKELPSLLLQLIYCEEIFSMHLSVSYTSTYISTDKHDVCLVIHHIHVYRGNLKCARLVSYFSNSIGLKLWIKLRIVSNPYKSIIHGMIHPSLYSTTSYARSSFCHFIHFFSSNFFFSTTFLEKIHLHVHNRM